MPIQIFEQELFLIFQQILITFNDQEVRNSPFLITVSFPESTTEILVNDDVDSPGNEITR